MGELYLYNALGGQLEPRTEGTVEAEGTIDSLVDDPAELWLDAGRNRAFAQLRADWSGTNRDIDQYRAVYEGDPNESIIEEFAPALDEVEAGTRWEEQASWSFIKEEKFDLPWVVSSIGDETLQTLGLAPRQELAIVRLLEDGEQLRLGMETTESAAVAAAYLYRTVESSVTIAISTGGPEPPVESVDLFLQPGSEHGDFYALTEATKSKLLSRVDSLVEDVKSAYRSRVSEVLEELVGSVEFGGWETHQELSRVKAAIQRLEEQASADSNPTTRAGEDLVDLRATLENGDRLSRRLRTDVLDRQDIKDLIDWTVQELENKQAEIEENALDRARGELLDVVDRVTDLRDDTAARSIGLMVERTNGADLDGRRTHRLVDEFARHYSELENSKLLSQSEVDDIRNEVRTELQDRKAAYEQSERDRIESLFQSAIDEFFRGSGSTGRLLQQARTALENAGGDDEIPAVTPPFDRALRELRENTIFEDESDIRDDVLGTLDEKAADLREAEKASEREQLKGKLDSLRRDTTVDTEFVRLCLALLVVDGHKEPPDDVSRIENFVRAVDRLEQRPVLTGSDVQTIQQELQSDIDGMLDEVRESKLSTLTDDIDRWVSSAPASDRDVESAVESLTALAAHCQSDRSDSQSFADEEWVQRTKQHIDSVRSLEYEGIPYFPQEKQRKALDEIAGIVESRATELSDQKQKNIQQRFSEAVQELRDLSSLSAGRRLRILSDFRSTVTAIGTHNRTVDDITDQAPVEEYSDPARDPASTIAECLDVLVQDEPPAWLNSDREKALMDHFKTEIDEASDSLEGQVVDTLVQQLQETVHDEYVATSEREPGIIGLDEAIGDLRSITERLPEARHEANKIRFVSGLDEDFVDRFERLSTDGRDRVVSDLIDWIEGEIDNIRATITERAANAVLDEIDLRGNGSADPETELRKFTAAATLLKGRQPETGTDGLDTKRLATAQQVLDEENQETLISRVEDSRTTAFRAYHELVIERVSYRLEEFLNGEAGSTVELESLSEYSKGNDRKVSNEHLRVVEETIDDVRAKRKAGVISSEESKRVQQDIRKEIEDAIATMEPESPLARIRGAFGSTGDEPTSLSSHSRFRSVVVIVAALAALLSAAVITTGFADGILSQAVGTGPSGFDITTVSVIAENGVVVIVAAALAALLVAAVATTGFGGGMLSQAAGTGPSGFDISTVSVTAENDVVVVEGAVSASVEDLEIVVVGPRVEVSRTVKPQNGEFRVEVQRGESGIYEARLRSTAEEPWKTFRTDVA